MSRFGASVSVLCLSFALSSFAQSCGDDSSDPPGSDGGVELDVALVDSIVGEDTIMIDSWSSSVDGGTSCETETCKSTEMCVACNCGGPMNFRCLPVPSGCETDRSCTCLTDSICSFAPVEAWCVDQPRDSLILCETGLD